MSDETKAEETTTERWDRLAKEFEEPVVRKGKAYEVSTHISMSDEGPIWVVHTKVGTVASEDPTHPMGVIGKPGETLERVHTILMAVLQRLIKTEEEVPPQETNVLDVMMAAGRMKRKEEAKEAETP